MPPRKKASTTSNTSSAVVEAPVQEAPTQTVSKKKDPRIVELPDFSEKSMWTFELTGGKPAVLKISNDELRAFNPETKRYENIRYCEGHDSIWVADQEGQFVKKGFIVFTDGELEVSRTETTKLEFIFHHPEYNKSFRLKDLDRDANKKLADEKVLMEALNKAMTAPYKELKLVALAKGLNASTEALCRTAMFDYARNQPTKFLDSFDNELIRVSAKIREGLNQGILEDDGKHLRWSDTKSRIMTLVSGLDTVEYAASRLVDPTDDNVAFLSELTRKIQ